MTVAGHVLGEQFRVDSPGVAAARGGGAIVALAGGRFVIAFSSDTTADPDRNAVSAQFVTATGQADGAPFLLPTSLQDIQNLIGLEPRPDGGFIALWRTETPTAVSVMAQHFDSTGAAEFGELVLRTDPVGSIFYNPEIQPLTNGNLLLIWRANSPAAPLLGQIYTANGVGIGNPFDIVGANGIDSGFSMEQLSDGRLVVTWAKLTAATGADSFARILNADGTLSGDVFAVNTTLAGGQGGATTAAFADGRFVAVWVSALNGRQDLYGQLFAADGSKIGAEFLVNVTDNTYNQYPDVAVLDDQSFVVTWQRPSYYINAQGFVVDQGYGVTAQLFAGDGTRVGNQTWIDDTNVNRYLGPSIEALTSGGYVVSWADNADFSTALRGRIFGPNSPPSFLSPDHASVAENTQAVLLLQASDPDINARLSYAVSGGPDAQFFGTDPRGSQLVFINAPDFEGTAFHSNTYTVQVSVSDGHATTYQTLTINVTDVREPVHLIGTAAADTLTGTEFGDWLEGMQGADTLYGDLGDDSLDGGDGADLLYGGAGNDTYQVTAGDLVFEAADQGYDRVIATSSTYLFANLEALILDETAADGFGVGNDLDNLLIGNSGANLLIAHGGLDTVVGGGGNDLIYGMDGTDLLFGNEGVDFIAGGNGDDVIDGELDADSLHGEAGNDEIWAGSGFVTDILTGGDGNDGLHIDSGEGDYDLADGGSGDDTFWVDSGDDRTFEAVGGGSDTVRANVNVANGGVYLYANVENLILEGTTTFGVGNELANRLTGNAGGNWLLGGDGDDILAGEGGNDVLFGQAGADMFVFAPGSGADLIGDFAPGSDRIDLSAFGYSWAGVQEAMGQNGGDTFINLLNGDIVVLQGVTISQLGQGDFLLSV